MIVAALAYHDLNTEDRAKAFSILAQHENNAKWKAEVPAGESSVDAGIIAFMGASKWPDEIKFGHSKWNHKEWHYVDFPVKPPDFAFTSSPAPENDIVYAINLCMKNLKSETVSTADKACWLAWMIHLVGDIHQPLHCCALVNEDFPAPAGDRGGNSIFVKASPTGTGIHLHKMFDDAPGTSKGFHFKLLRSYVNQSIALGAEYNRDSLLELSQHQTPESWARESWEIDVRDVYLRGALAYGKTSETAALLPEGYTKKLKSIASIRLALAGYRLADLIREAVR